MMRRWPRAAASVLLLAVAGCGSTIERADLSGGPAEPGAPATRASEAPLGRTDGVLGGATGTTDAPDGSDAAPTGSGPRPASGGGASAVRVGPGVTAREIRIGVIYSDDEEAVAQQFGIRGISSADKLAQYQALVTDINRNGGVLGRRLVLVPYNQRTAEYLSAPAAWEQAACSHWTEDEPVFAVLYPGLFTLTPCLAARGVTTIQGAGWLDATDATRQRAFYPGGIYFHLLAKVFVARLVAQRYFTGWNTATGEPGPAPVKVGMLYENTAASRRYHAAIRAQLTAMGIAMADDYVYENSLDTIASGSQSAVLRFASEGVTHVFHAALFFFQAAENQQYHPRYSIDSQVPPALTAQNVSSSQLHGALGVGFMPTWDVERAQDPGDVSPQVRRCRDVMKRAGIAPPANRDSEFVLAEQCESVWALVDALRAAGRPAPDALPAAFDTFGDRPSVVTFVERWGGGRRASASVVADLQYVDACSCFSYTRARTRV